MGIIYIMKTTSVHDYGLMRQVVCEGRGLTLQGPLY